MHLGYAQNRRSTCFMNPTLFFCGNFYKEQKQEEFKERFWNEAPLYDMPFVQPRTCVCAHVRSYVCARVCVWERVHGTASEKARVSACMWACCHALCEMYICIAAVLPVSSPGMRVVLNILSHWAAHSGMTVPGTRLWERKKRKEGVEKRRQKRVWGTEGMWRDKPFA